MGPLKKNTHTHTHRENGSMRRRTGASSTRHEAPAAPQTPPCFHRRATVISATTRHAHPTSVPLFFVGRSASSFHHSVDVPSHRARVPCDTVPALYSLRCCCCLLLLLLLVPMLGASHRSCAQLPPCSPFRVCIPCFRGAQAWFFFFAVGGGVHVLAARHEGMLAGARFSLSCAAPPPPLFHVLSRRINCGWASATRCVSVCVPRTPRRAPGVHDG